MDVSLALKEASTFFVTCGFSKPSACQPWRFAKGFGVDILKGMKALVSFVWVVEGTRIFSCSAEWLETLEVSVSYCPVEVGREEELEGAGVLTRLLVRKYDPPVSEGRLQGSMVWLKKRRALGTERCVWLASCRL